MGKKKLIWTFVSILIAGCSIWAVTMQSKNFSLRELKLFIAEAEKGWLVLAALCMFGFIFFEGYALLCILKELSYHRNLAQGTIYSAANVYFSAITPSASGGQPASAFFMLRDAIPGTAVTVSLLLNMIMYNFALITVGGICMFLRFDLFMEFSLISRCFIGVGCVVLFFLAFVFYMALKKEKMLYGLSLQVMKMLKKMHLLKNGDAKMEKFQHTMQEYRRCSEIVSGQTGMLLRIYFWNLCQRISQFGVSFMIFKAVGYGYRTAFDAWQIQSFVSMGSNCVPIPGSMGVADYLMLDGFVKVIGEQKATYMELLCRSMSFYGCILTSILIVSVGYIAGRKRRRVK